MTIALKTRSQCNSVWQQCSCCSKHVTSPFDKHYIVCPGETRPVSTSVPAEHPATHPPLQQSTQNNHAIYELLPSLGKARAGTLYVSTIRQPHTVVVLPSTADWLGPASVMHHQQTPELSLATACPVLTPTTTVNQTQSTTAGMTNQRLIDDAAPACVASCSC